MNIPRQQKRTEATAAATAAQKNAEPKREDRWVSQFYMNNKNSSEPHMWCAHENPRFYLFSDVIFFSYVCFFLPFSRWIRFKNKVRFSSFRASLRKSPSVVAVFFFSVPFRASHFLSSSIFRLAIPYIGEKENVCVAHVDAANVHTRYL